MGKKSLRFKAGDKVVISKNPDHTHVIGDAGVVVEGEEFPTEGWDYAVVVEGKVDSWGQRYGVYYDRELSPCTDDIDEEFNKLRSEVQDA